MALSRVLRSLPMLGAICLVAAAATAGQIALASPPLEWPTDIYWAARPRNLFVVVSALLAALSAVAAVAQLFGPEGATRKQVEVATKGLGHVSRQVGAEGAASERRDAQTQRQISDLPQQVSDQLLPELRKIAEGNPTAQLKDIEVSISIKMSFSEHNQL